MTLMTEEAIRARLVEMDKPALRALAERAGLSYNTVRFLSYDPERSRYYGRSPSYGTLVKLSRVLDA